MQKKITNLAATCNCPLSFTFISIVYVTCYFLAGNWLAYNGWTDMCTLNFTQFSINVLQGGQNSGFGSMSLVLLLLCLRRQEAVEVLCFWVISTL